MDNKTRNLIIIVVGVVVGLPLGFMYPIIGLLLLIPLVGYVAFIFLNNKGGAEADEATAKIARQFTASEGKAAIYIMRKGFVGGQQGLIITINDELSTQFRTGRFVKAEVEPGEHSVASQMASQTKGTARTHSVTLAAGECVLLDAQIKMGALQGSIEMIEIHNPAEAREKLAGLKLVEWKDPLSE